MEEAARDPKLRVDSDTKGVAGSPPIVDTIFRKIDDAAVFVPDLTFIGKRPDDRPTPNPNVLVEYGWALKSLTYGRMVPVMNTAYGEPSGDAMPFDMRHLRNPITYNCPADLDAAALRQVRETLAKDLERAIRLVFESDEYKASLPKQPTPASFLAREPVDGRGRFKAIGEPIGLRDGGFRGSVEELFVSAHPVSWFRLMPLNDPGRTWTVGDLQRAMQSPMIQPLSPGWTGYDAVRSVDGYGICAFYRDQRDQIRALAFAFTTGEVWSIDTYWLEAYSDDKGQPTVPSHEEHSFRVALVAYSKLLERLGIEGPFKWIAGMENLKGRFLYVPVPQGHMRFRSGPDGKCLEDMISASGQYSPGDAPGPALKPFFEKLYNACGVPRQDWQDK